MYWQPPAAAEMVGTGLKPKHFKPPEVSLWPENWPVIELFLAMQTQWRMGPCGPVGLDYQVVFHELDRRNLNQPEYDDIMDGIRVVESAALLQMRK